MSRRFSVLLLLGAVLCFLLGATLTTRYFLRSLVQKEASLARVQRTDDIAASEHATTSRMTDSVAEPRPHSADAVREFAPSVAPSSSPPAAPSSTPSTPTPPAPSGAEASGGAPVASDAERPKAARYARRRQPRQGLLTAGVIDDVLQWDRYLEYLQNTMQQDKNELLPRAGMGKRLFVQVVDQQQRPVQDAIVTLRSETGPLLTHHTAADGMVQYISGYDGAAAPVQVTVETADETVTQDIHDGEDTCVVTLEKSTGRMPQALDLALVIDTTGSMGDELAYLKRELQHITSQVAGMFPNVEQRFALVVYRDNGDQYVMRSHDFTGDIQSFQANLNQQQASGGGDTPEAMDVAMQRAMTLDWSSGRTARMIFLVGDAPPHDPDLAATLETSNACRENAIRIYPVAASGVRDKAEYLMRSLAALTGGQYLFLTDHSGVGNPHHDPHVDQYAVELLEQAMLRMISSELTGKRLAADEILAIEAGKLQYDQINHDDFTHVVYHPPQLPEQPQQVEPWQAQTTPVPVAVPQPRLPPTPVYYSARRRGTPWQEFWKWLDRYAMPFALANFGVGAVFLGFSLWHTQRQLLAARAETDQPLEGHETHGPSEPRKPPQF